MTAPDHYAAFVAVALAALLCRTAPFDGQDAPYVGEWKGEKNMVDGSWLMNGFLHHE